MLVSLISFFLSFKDFLFSICFAEINFDVRSPCGRFSLCNKLKPKAMPQILLLHTDKECKNTEIKSQSRNQGLTASSCQPLFPWQVNIKWLCPGWTCSIYSGQAVRVSERLLQMKASRAELVEDICVIVGHLEHSRMCLSPKPACDFSSRQTSNFICLEVKVMSLVHWK